MDIFNEILDKVKGDYVDIFFEEKSSTQLNMEENRVQKCAFSSDKGVGVRVIRDKKTYYAYTNDFSKEGIFELIRALNLRDSKGRSIDLKRIKPSIIHPVNILPSAASISERIGFVRRANDLAWSLDKKIKQVKVYYGDTVQRVKIANSDFKYVDEERIYTLFFIHVVTAENGVIQTGYEAVGGLKGLELFEENEPEKVAEKAATRALMMLKARRVKGGRMPVVISSEAGGTMIHEAVGHGLEADLVLEGLSVYADKLGSKIASPEVTVIDDSTLLNMRGSYSFDDEGTQAQRTILVDKGVLVNYLYDRYTSLITNKQSTGNGRRQSYEHYPIPRMSNTYIAPGTYAPDEIIRSVEKGFFVKKMGGGQVNTVTGEFVFEVQEGYTIEKGLIGEPVRGALLIGTGQEILNSIDMVGNDLGFSIGTCGKNSQGVPVTDGMPTLRIPEIVVGGETD